MKFPEKPIVHVCILLSVVAIKFIYVGDEHAHEFCPVVSFVSRNRSLVHFPEFVQLTGAFITYGYTVVYGARNYLLNNDCNSLQYSWKPVEEAPKIR